MLIEAWERLRGYNHWTETQAVIESANVQKESVPGPFDNISADTLSWMDLTGQKHSARFTVPDDSPLFKLGAGQTVIIRYNPAGPDRFYLRDLLRTRIHAVLRTILFWIFALLAIGVIILYNYIRHRHRHYLW